MAEGDAYRPSNGTEGEIFQERWCNRCAIDRPWQDAQERDIPENLWPQPCPILTRAFAFQISDAEYPREWIYNAKGIPECTAFVKFKDKEINERCLKTIDLFGNSGGQSH